MSDFYNKYIKDYQKSPKGKYIAQRASAGRRGIYWDISFEDWWAIWQKSGKWEERGNHRNSFCMARIKDNGPYHKDNVEIKAIYKNSSETQANKRYKKEQEQPSDYWKEPISVFNLGWIEGGKK